VKRRTKKGKRRVKARKKTQTKNSRERKKREGGGPGRGGATRVETWQEREPERGNNRSISKESSDIQGKKKKGEKK